MRKRALVLAWAVVAGIVGCPAPDHPSKFGVNDAAFSFPYLPWMAGSPPTPPSALDLAKQADLKWVRLWAAWAAVERDADNDFHWEVIGNEIKALNDRGFSIVLSFVGVPPWANRVRAGQGGLDSCSGGAAFMPADWGIPPDNGSTYFPDFLREVATRYGDQVKAIDLWNEPQVCQFWRGSKAEWRDKILVPGFDAIKAVRPDMLVGGPGVNINLVTDYDSWFTYTNAAGRAVLLRSLDFVSFHHYGTPTQVKNSITGKASFQRCNADQSYCVSDFWLTEFGFSSGACPYGGGDEADPGAAAREVFDTCEVTANCKRALIWDIWRPAHETCEYALLVGDPPVPTDSKYATIQGYITNKSMPIGEVVFSSPGAVSWDSNRIDVFARGSTAHLYQKTWNGIRWSDWQDRAGSFDSGASVASWAPGRLDVFARGDPDHTLWHRWFDAGAGGWTPNWGSLGGVLTSDPAAVSWGPNRIDVFVRGADSRTFYWIYWNGAAWSAWSPLLGQFLSGAAAASWGSGHIDLFGVGPDGAVWQSTYEQATGWSPWTTRGGAAASDPAAVSWGPNRIDLFVQGTDGSYYWQYWNGAAWSNWFLLGGAFSSAPDVASRSPGRLDLFGRGLDFKPYHRAYDTASGWAPSWDVPF